MGYSRITLDTHTLIWYLHEESNIRLSEKALTTIMEAEANGTIYVPTVVLIEVMRLFEKGSYQISLDDMLQEVEKNEVYSIVPLTTAIVRTMRNIHDLELHDRVIVATAVMTDSALVSMDISISESYDLVVW